MNEDVTRTSACSPEEIDEAAVWIARLRAPDRTARLDRGLRRWLAEKPSHAAAFELMSNAWELAGALQPHASYRPVETAAARPRPRLLRMAAAAACAVALVAFAIVFQAYDRGIKTDVGEQRVLSLEDGTRIVMNTATHLTVRYDESARRVELDKGEALFEVAKRPSWPFVVSAGDRQITALGTSFVVREERGALSVTMIEGSVAVRPDASAGDAGAPGSSTDVAASSRAVTLKAGDRLRLRDDGTPVIDQPPIDRLTAWRHGQVEFEDTALPAAAREMNRYSKLQLAVEMPEPERIRIDGVFRAGDTPAFAEAVARSYGLSVEWRARKVVLRGALPPAAPNPPDRK
jgi:transmembrane sensor